MSLDKKIQQSIQFIQTIAKQSSKPLYAGNSGGKDSAVVDKLLQMSQIPYHSFYTNTTIDPPGTVQHIKKHYPHTEILRPKETFLQLVRRKGLPTRLNRFCCALLKEYGSVGKMVFEGVRSAESTERTGRDYIQCDSRSCQKGAQHIYPIYDWSDADVVEFIKCHAIVLAPHYQNSGEDERLGCVGCPLVSKKGQRASEFARYPGYWKAITNAIGLGMSENPQWKLTCATDGDANEAMRWWLSNETLEEFYGHYEFAETDAGWVKTLSSPPSLSGEVGAYVQKCKHFQINNCQCGKQSVKYDGVVTPTYCNMKCRRMRTYRKKNNL